MVEEAKAKGATVVIGGEASPMHGELHYQWGFEENILWENTFYILYFRPTILTGVTADMQLCQEEIFGPVVSIQKFSDEKVSSLFYKQHLAGNILQKTQ